MTLKTAAPPPAEAAKPAKRTTRSSIRHSLNLASVGKALADVMNKEKDGKDTDRKKDSTRRQSTSSLSSKETAARRTSTINVSKSGNTLESVPEGQAKGVNSSGSTPDQKTVTATRRISSSLQRAGRSSVDETGVKVTSATIPSQSATVNNRTTTTLRPRKPAASATNVAGAAGNSALPKYRPKSVIVEGSPKETLSAIRVGTRRKHSVSEEDKDKDDKDSTSLETSSLNGASTEMDKAARPISPIPRRASKSSGSRSASIDCGRRSLSRDARSSLDRTPTTSTPPRPKKTQRPSSSPVLKKSGLPSGLPRPSPRGDTSSASGSPHTPSSAKKLVSRYLPGSSSSGRDSPSPLRTSATANTHARRSTITSIKKDSITSSSDSNQNTPTAPVQLSSSTQKEVGNDSIDDIEMMLPAVTSPSAPTPSIPRIGSVYQAPEPPDLARHPSSILDLSLSLSTPQSERLSLPPSRRTTPNRRPAADRNSTVAWQALADLSLEINADQLQGGLITELDLPSTPLGLISPSPSMMRLDSEDGHERCPTPLNLGSPSKYASISQLLLSNGSAGYPSAAPHLLPPNNNKTRNNLNRKKSTESDAAATESAVITLLKLQLASMENLAKERLTQISKLEEQMHVLKESRKRDERELLTHVNELEERLHETLVAQHEQQRSRSRAASVCSMRSTNTSSSARGGDVEDSSSSHEACQSLLESRIRELEDTHAHSLTEALSSLAQRERAERTRLLTHLDTKQRLTLTARDAQQTWRGVHEIAECELEAISANRETLDVLRAGLDLFERQMRSGCGGNGKIPVGAAARFHLA
ncbi:uncharacterized protein FOMMEDRAFT_167586 [Fomitiporia mediterranea MF3/22]|uniref:uncharacterized protein n=1 Tax=Fomitiporia mediterranea (strain MF3/22) TaxID=694068 RepID=UPI0004408E62|nr:uncharacterized protein FOMMEDRAFT_167586 [Fomitiporia mediterranea MF3/22]EJD04391.1 hypothetical protein FOMMEDRAFT_167586 [Fomitiporia mediterranea MF3/22]